MTYLTEIKKIKKNIIAAIDEMLYKHWNEGR